MRGAAGRASGTWYAELQQRDAEYGQICALHPSRAARAELQLRGPAGQVSAAAARQRAAGRRGPHPWAAAAGARRDTNHGTVHGSCQYLYVITSLSALSVRFTANHWHPELHAWSSGSGMPLYPSASPHAAQAPACRSILHSLLHCIFLPYPWSSSCLPSPCLLQNRMTLIPVVMVVFVKLLLAKNSSYYYCTVLTRNKKEKSGQAD